MKKFIKPVIIIATFSIAGLLFAFRSDDIEMPDYRVIKKYENVEIRQYPAMVIAQTMLNKSTNQEQMSGGFRVIAGYIFGGNERNEKIAMTAPVVMKMGDSASMYFMMPKQYSTSELPKPNSKEVKILEEKPRVMAVIRYDGFSSDDKIKKYTNELAAIIAKYNLKTSGAYMYMGYNAPWDIINRRNEIAIEVFE
ncbi:MAG: SOUL family heme-binding protein [bacterium]